jgi:hypothetical protein
MYYNSFYRITKYNPKFRDKHDRYQVDDWTAAADIGKQFANGVLSLDEYLQTEGAYVESLLQVWELAGRPEMTVTGFEANELRLSPAHLGKTPQLREILKEDLPAEDQVLRDGAEIERVIRLVLREFIWCKLESNSDFYAHFGWDYYMYSGGVELDDTTRQSIGQRGLFVEVGIASPYG